MDPWAKNRRKVLAGILGGEASNQDPRIITVLAPPTKNGARQLCLVPVKRDVLL